MTVTPDYEKTLSLSEKEYALLSDVFGCRLPSRPLPAVRQIDYYFDTDSLAMYRRNVTCRIRLRDGHFEGEIARRAAASDRVIRTGVGVYDGLSGNGFTDMGLKFQGSLVTESRTLFSGAFCTVTLDRNDYLGVTDRELKLGYPPGYEKEAGAVFVLFLALLRRDTCPEIPCAVPRNVKSKSARFFERKLSLATSAEYGKIAGENPVAAEKKEARTDDMPDDTGFPRKFPDRNTAESGVCYSYPDDYMSDIPCIAEESAWARAGFRISCGAGSVKTGGERHRAVLCRTTSGESGAKSRPAGTASPKTGETGGATS